MIIVCRVIPLGRGLAQGRLIIADTNGQKGAQVIVPVILENEVGASGLQFRVTFDSSRLTLPETFVLPGEALEDHGLGVSRGDGELRVLILSTNALNLKPSQNVLLRILFDIATDAAGAVLSEAGVGASPVSQHFSIPVLFEAGVTNTGIALANVSGQNAQDILLELVDSDGTVLSTQMRDVEGDHHEALFANQFFLELDAMGSFEGSIRVWSPVDISVVALRQQGLLLTTFPSAELP